MTRPLFREMPPGNYQSVHFDASAKTVYLLARVWGITGNSEEVRICSTPIGFEESEDCLVFHTSEMFYRRLIRTICKYT
jgi:hypothetical protein